MQTKEFTNINIKFGGTRIANLMPFTGLLLKNATIDPLDPKNLTKFMKNNENIGLTPGGFEEATLT